RTKSMKLLSRTRGAALRRAAWRCRGSRPFRAFASQFNQINNFDRKTDIAPTFDYTRGSARAITVTSIPYGQPTELCFQLAGANLCQTNEKLIRVVERYAANFKALR